MAITVLGLIEAIRIRLDDTGGDTGVAPGYYAYWQWNDQTCLWSNADLVSYLNRGLLDVARRAPWTAEGIRTDVQGDPDRLVVVANQPEVSLHPSTLAVEQVRLVSSGFLLTKTESGRLSARNESNRFSRTSSSWTEQTGTPTHYLEPRPGVLRLYPIPLIADELRLIVRRRVLTPAVWATVATESTPTATLADVPDDLEEALIVATCRYAYLKRDADAYNLSMAQDCERQLTDLIGPVISWRHQEARRINANLTTAIRGVSARRRVENFEFEEH